MKINCNVIKDLIVLHDAEGCSIDSEQLIEDHIASCETCRILWENTQSVKVDGLIAQPIDNFNTMCRRIKKKSKKRTILFSVFWAIAAVIITLLAIKFVRMPHTLTSNEIQVADVYYEEGMLVFKIETKNGSAIGTSSGYILESCGKEGKYILSTWCDKFAGRAEQEIDAAFFIQTYWDISELYMKNENGEKEIIWENNGDYSALTEEIKEEIEYTKQYRE